MAIRFKRVLRVADPRTPQTKKYFASISYKYDTPMTLKESALEISAKSGVSEGTAYSVLKDFRTLLRKTLLSGRSVNVEGLGYFYLAAQGEGRETAEELSATDITGLRICFRANKDIRLTAQGPTRTDGLVFKDLDRLEGDGLNPGTGTDEEEGGGESPMG